MPIELADDAPSELSRQTLVATPQFAFDSLKRSSKRSAFLAPGTIIDERYRIESFIGTGNMCEVYSAFHLQLMKPVALKMLLPRLMTDPQNIERFQREAIAVAALQHPNIVQVYGFGYCQTRFQSRVYIALEFVGGCTLADYANQQFGLRLSRECALPIFEQICDALEHAHSKGVIHRDLKPSNIMISSDGTVKVLDFGIAKFTPDQSKLKQKLTQTGEVVGSVAYMSPEQCSGQELDQRTDLYSLGCLMYETLTGELPMRGENHYAVMYKHLFESPPSLSNVDDDLGALVMRVLSKDPSGRPQSASELRRALADLRSSKKNHHQLANPVVFNFAQVKPFLVAALLLITCGLACLALSAREMPIPAASADVLDSAEWTAARLLEHERLEECQDPAEAMRICRRILHLQHRAPVDSKLEALSCLSRLSSAKGDDSQAIAYAKRQISLAPKSKKHELDWEMRGYDVILIAYARQHKPQEVWTICKKQERLLNGKHATLEQAERLSHAYDMRAQSLRELGDQAGVRIFICKAAEVLEDYPMTCDELTFWLPRYNRYIVSLIEQRQFAKAELAAARELQFLPTLSEASCKTCAVDYCERAVGWAHAGYSKNAFADLKTAKDLDPQDKDIDKATELVIEILEARVPAAR